MVKEVYKMAAYIKTLYDSTKTDILYPQTKAEAVFLNNNDNVEAAISEIYSLIENMGGVDIQTSTTQPTNQKTGDFWYQIV